MDEGEQGMFDIGHDIADEARSGVLSLGEKRVSAGGVAQFFDACADFLV